MKIFSVTICLLVFISSPNTIEGQTIAFSKPVDIGNGGVSGVSALDAADLNNDGLMDIAVMEGGAHSGGRVTVAWFEQTRDKNWIRHEFGSPELLDDFIGAARCGDMDNDGNVDVVFTNDGHSTGPLKVYMFKNPGKWKVSGKWPCQEVASIEGFHANDMRLADMDSDGKMDIVIRHKNPESVKVIFQITGNKWLVKTAHEGQAGEGLAVGDINGDGLPDITMTGHWLKTPGNPHVDNYLRFDIEAGFKLINKATKEEVGDINGDGRPDVVLSPAEHFPAYGGDNYDLAWYECPENPEEYGAWKKHVIRGNLNKAHCLKLSDFDNDGDLDVLNAVGWDDREIRIYLNDNGSFENALQVATGKGIYSGAVVDLDRDGDADIVGEDKYSTDSRPWFYENLLTSNEK